MQFYREQPHLAGLAPKIEEKAMKCLIKALKWMKRK